MAISTTPIAAKEMVGGRVSLISSTVTAVRVGATNLTERKQLYIQNACKVPVYIMSRSVSGTSTEATDDKPLQDTVARRGIKLKAGTDIWLPVQSTITVYASMHTDGSTGSGFLRIVELA